MEKLIKPNKKNIRNRKIEEIYNYISYQDWKVHTSANLMDYHSILDNAYHVCSSFQKVC